MSRLSSWDDVVTNFSSRLSKWKLKTHSIGGHLTLIIYVLSSLPLYYMSSFKVPKGVLSNMETIRRNFFNGVENAEKKIHIWVRGALDNPPSYSRRSLWLYIISKVKKLSNKGIDLLSLVKKKIRNGEATFFWNDVWLCDFPIKQTYPRLYFLNLDKHASVASKLRDNSLSSCFRRSPRSDIEEEQLFLLILNTSSVILSNIIDRWTWRLDSSSFFSVKSAREFIDDSFLPKAGVSTRWVKFIPIKINIFAWRVSLNKLPTRLNLSLRGVDIPSIICPLCSIAVESTPHLLFSCQLARQLMLKVVRWWELKYQDFLSYDDWLLWLNNLRVFKRFKDVFEDLLFDEIVRLSFYWCSSRCSSNFDWNAWMKNRSSIDL
nr:RNA-directed DNA polymerase, eukaryota, reverse transcriptase zinc-binding domain protein [Tanacetum cinerariifolium]